MTRFKRGDRVEWVRCIYVYGCIDPTDKTRALISCPGTNRIPRDRQTDWAWTAPLAELRKAGE